MKALRPFPPLVRDRAPAPLTPDQQKMVRREEHYRRALGPIRQPGVYHFEDDGDPHVDVYVHARTRAREFETMITGGMADRAMPGLPNDLPIPPRVELLLKIRRAADWAAVILHQLARIPFELGIPLVGGLAIEGDRPICPGSRLHHAFLFPAVEERRLRGFRVDGEPVSFLRLNFLSPTELRYAVRHGPFDIAEALHHAGEAVVVNPGRDRVI